jgi:predicted ArsR family transcriptional regulator
MVPREIKISLPPPKVGYLIKEVYTMAELKMLRLSSEEAHQFALLAWGQIYANSLQALVDKLGSEEALRLLHPYLERVGESAPAMAQMMGITGNDATAIASLIHLFDEQVLLVEGRPTEVSTERVVKEITKCPFQDFAPEFCLALLSANQGMVKAMNPEYTFMMPKFIPNGDPICQWILEKK